MNGPGERRVPVGRLALGVLLLILGTGWLLQTLGVIDAPWQALLAVSLIMVGVAMVAVGHHGGLVTLGVVLTVLLAFTSIVDVPLVGGVGQRTYRPTSAAEVQPDYRMAMGQLTVDLGDVALPPGGTRVEVSLGMGELVVIVPADAEIRVGGRAAIGEVLLLGQARSGLGVEHDITEGDGPRLDLKASVGIGKVEVRR